MAGNIFIPLKTILDDSGIKKAQSAFGKLGKSIKGALGAVGVGLGTAALTRQLSESAKAAAQDAKSQGLLANALRNTVGANNEQIASVEKSISAMESMAAVADDNIRPAFAQLARATGDVSKATDLTNVALNVAAGTGRDLNSVAIALGRAYNGNTTALSRLGVNVKGVSDPIAVLAKQFEGAAEAAADLDPYQRLQIVFGNLQEDIGRALLPYLNELADYFASEEGQQALGDFADTVAELGTSMFELAGAIVDTGLLDLLTDFVTIAAKIAKLDFSGVFDQLNANVYEGWLDKYLNNRPQFDKDMEVLIENEKDYYDRIMAFIKKNKPGTGMGGSVLDQYLAQTGLRGGLGTAPKVISGNAALANATKGMTTAQKAAQAAAKAAAEAIQKATDAANEQAKAYADAAEAAGKFLSETRKLTDGFVSLFQVQRELGAFELAAVDAFTSILDTIDAALADGMILSDAASRLREYAVSERTTLQGIAKQRDILAGKLDVARTITTGVTGLLNITNLLETTSRSVTETVSSIVNGIQVATTKTFDVVSNGGLVDNFQKLVDKTKAFAKNLIDLKKLGLNKQLFAQLVNAGADAGGATAQAIVEGGADTISALNGLYNELALSAGDIAATATDTLYEVGQQVVSNGFIAGLLAQESELQRAAETLANAFASTFQTQLQLAVDETLPNQVSLIDQVAAVTGGAGGRMGGIAFNSASAGRGTIFNVNVSAGVVTDPNALAKTVIDSVKKYERSNGSVWVAA